jgi:hypothetical protein
MRSVERTMRKWLERRRIRVRAGGLARQEYRRLLHQWWHTKRAFFIAFGLIVLGVYVALFVVSRDHLWVFFAGMLAGGFLALFVAALNTPPSWIENYQLGAWGESRTAKTLTPLLNDGWTVINDISRWKSNLDHVLVGPAGVFVLDTKNYSGTITVERGNLTLAYGSGKRARVVGDALARQARAQGAALHEVLQRRGIERAWASAIIVFWAEFPQQIAGGNRVTYVHGDALVSWLRSQPTKLTPERVAAVAGALRSGQRRAP